MNADEHVAAMAASRHGVLTTADALRAGLSSKQVRHRVAGGRWRQLASGVFVVVGAPMTWQQRALAAVLASADGAVASHLTAAALHGLHPAPARPHVIVPPTAGARVNVAIVHRSPLDLRDRCRVAGIPTTTATRTLFDVAALLSEHALAELVDDALCQGLSSADAVLRTIGRAPVGQGRRGVPRLRRVIAVWSAGIEPGSAAEMRLLRCLGDWGLPAPEPQWRVRDERGRVIARLDLAWPTCRVGLEYDSDRHHNPRHWGHDESRHAVLERLGWRVRHVGKFDLLPSATGFRDDLARLHKTARREAS